MSATPYQNLYDIDGLDAAIVKTTQHAQEFNASATTAYKNAGNAAARLRKELEAINASLLNNGRPITLFDDAGAAAKIQALSQQVQNLTSQYNTQKAAIETLKSVQAQNNAAISDARVQAAQYRAELEKGRVAGQNTRNETAKLTLQMRQLSLANRQAASGLNAANGSYREAQQRLSALGKSIREAEGGFTNTTPAIRAQIVQYNQLNDKLKAFDAQMGNHQRNVGNYKSALGGLAGQLTSLAAGYISVEAALSAFMATFDAVLKLDATKASLQYTLGSTDLAADKLSELGKVADRLGLNFEVLTGTYASFAGAAKASNFDMATAEKVFLSVSGAASRFNLTSDQLSGALLALQQMISKGKVQAEELRGQLGERLPGAFGIAARAMKMTEAELDKMLSTGQVTARDLLPKLATELDKTFSLDKNTKVETLTGSVNNLKNAFTESVAEGENLNSFLKSSTDNLGFWAKALANIVNSNSWKEFWYRFSTASQDDIGDAMHQATIAAQRVANAQNSAGNTLIQANSGRISTKEQIDEIKKLQDALNALRKNFANVDNAASKFNDIQGRIQKLKNIPVTSLLDDNLDTQKAVNQRISLLQKEESAQIKYSEVWNRIQELKKRTFKQAESDLTDAQLTSIAQIRKRISELSKLPGSAIEGSEINNRIDALKDRLKGLTPHVTKVKEGFASLQEQMSKVSTALEVAIIEDYIRNQGKESANTKMLADQYNNLAEKMANVQKLKEDALRQASIQDRIAQFGSLFPTAPRNGVMPVVDLRTGDAAIARQSAEDAVEAQITANAKITRDLTEQYRLRQLTKTQYEAQMLEATRGNTIIEYGLQKDLLEATQRELEANGKTNTKEYRNLKRQQFELDKKYNEDRISLDLQYIESVKATYDEVFSYIESSANAIGGNTGKLTATVANVAKEYAIAAASGVEMSTQEKLKGSLMIAGDAVGAYTELSIKASQARMKQIEAEYQHEIDLAGSNEEAKTAITNKYNEETRKERNRQAKAQKAQAIAQIAINTALAVSTTLGQTGFFGIPLAFIVGALGAAQLGLVLSQPIPEYAKGRNGGPSEFALVNEQGPEAIGHGGNYRIVNNGRKGITRLQSGDEVKTAAMTRSMMYSGELVRSERMADVLGGAKAIYDTFVLTQSKQKQLSVDDIADGVSMGMNGLPVEVNRWDERGYHKHQERMQSRSNFNRNRNSFN